MKKSVPIGPRPSAAASPAASADAWVGAGAEKTAEQPRAVDGKMKRLTIDIPESLHRAIKSQCAMRGTKIADEVRDLLTQKYESS